MGIPYAIILIIYLVIVLIFLFLSGFSLYDVVRFAPKNRVAHASMYGYILIVVLNLIVTWLALRQMDWAQTIDIVLPKIF